MKETQRPGFRCNDDIRRQCVVPEFHIPLYQVAGLEQSYRNWLGEVAACLADE